MLTGMSEADWDVVVTVFRGVLPRRGDKGRDDRKFLEGLHFFFTVHNITWRALPAEFGEWNSVWKRFWRLSQSGVFEAMFDALAATSATAHLVQMFDSTTARATSRRRAQKGAGRTGAGPLAWRLLDQGPPRGRLARPPSRLRPDARPGERQPALPHPARPRPGDHASRRHGR